jgi:hypothetical protein
MANSMHYALRLNCARGCCRLKMRLRFKQLTGVNRLAPKPFFGMTEKSYREFEPAPTLRKH